jgi:hypothetical protein
VEADDLGMYVCKFRGAGQGPLALAAELVAGEIGRALGLRVPELVFVEVDEALGRNEPDPEIHDLLLASTGLNLGLDYLPGSVMFDPAAGDTTAADPASETVWFDALVTNVDRTARNPNLLLWHKTLYLIDHGAALYFQHNWENRNGTASSRFPAIRDHILLRWAERIGEAGERLRPKLTEPVLAGILADVPDAWLAGSRDDYLVWLMERLAAAPLFTEEAIRARQSLL